MLLRLTQRLQKCFNYHFNFAAPFNIVIQLFLLINETRNLWEKYLNFETSICSIRFLGKQSSYLNTS